MVIPVDWLESGVEDCRRWTDVPESDVDVDVDVEDYFFRSRWDRIRRLEHMAFLDIEGYFRILELFQSVVVVAVGGDVDVEGMVVTVLVFHGDVVVAVVFDWIFGIFD